MAAKTATEQIMDIRYTLRYLGVPIRSKLYMFGDIRSVVTNDTLQHSTLSKRHNIMAFYRVREAIAAKIIDFHWIKSEYNLSYMLSKHWEHNDSKTTYSLWTHHTNPQVSHRTNFQASLTKGYSQYTQEHNHPPLSHFYTYNINFLYMSYTNTSNP